jgi:citrate lyase beta subunit
MNITRAARLRRTQLYIPGDDLHKIQKGTTLNADSLILDMEDGVALNRKEVARKTIREALGSLNFGRSERLVRINPINSGQAGDDLAAILPAKPDGIVIPKVEHAEDVQEVSGRIAELEQSQGWQSNGIRLLVLIETPLGVVNLKEIASSDERLDALILGQYDLAGSLGATITAEGHEVLYARSALVIHAAAFNLQAIDSVYVDLHDIVGLVRLSERALQMGYSGKQAIHPRQLESISTVFTPSDEAVLQARALVEAYLEHQTNGVGVFAFEGKMVDAPILRVAENVLARAHASGKLI